MRAGAATRGHLSAHVGGNLLQHCGTAGPLTATASHSVIYGDGALFVHLFSTPDTDESYALVIRIFAPQKIHLTYLYDFLPTSKRSSNRLHFYMTFNVCYFRAPSCFSGKYWDIFLKNRTELLYFFTLCGGPQSVKK